MKRAERRHHRQRIIRKFQRIYKNWDYENWEQNGLMTAARGSIKCGCCMCANPRSRRSYDRVKKTRAELVNDYNCDEQLREFYDERDQDNQGES